MPVELASMHSTRELIWQRTSPNAKNQGGPVLYQIIFRSSATPGNIPVISPQFTLMNSHISDTGTIINFSEPVSFAAGQTFPGAGTITAVNAGNGLTTSTVNGIATVGIADGGVGTTQIANSAVGTTQIGSGAAANGSVLSANGGGGVLFVTLPTVAPAWGLTGNAGTVDGTSFMGTTDNVALNLVVNGKRSYRIQPATDTQFNLGFSANVIGGSSFNAVTGTGTAGATIAGGGAASNGPNNSNTISASFGAIGGGFGNETSGVAATVSGGNINLASGTYSNVSGGGSNTASGMFSTVGGGQFNHAIAQDATVAGGTDNFAEGTASTVAGGQVNTVRGQGSFAAGQFTTDFNGTAHNGVFLWGDNSPWINFNETNLVASADNQFLARAIGGFQFIAGVDASGNPATDNTVSIAPGTGLMTFAAGQTFPGVLPLRGGTMSGNITFAGTQSFPGSVSSVSAGDGTITIGGTASAPTVAVGTINGGNIAFGQVARNVNGISDNVTLAAGSNIGLSISGQTLTIKGTEPGAWGPNSTNNAVVLEASTVAGGFFNAAGGAGATVSGGELNRANGARSSVGGGQNNVAGGNDTTIPGGLNNIANGVGSFAAGQFASDAGHNGVFVWGDSSNLGLGTTQTVAASADNQFLARASGGFQFISGVDSSAKPDATKTVTITSGNMAVPGNVTVGGSISLGIYIKTDTPTSAVWDEVCTNTSDIAISGGAYINSGSMGLRESRPTTAISPGTTGAPANAWRVTCVNSSGTDVACTQAYVVCLSHASQ